MRHNKPLLCILLFALLCVFALSAAMAQGTQPNGIRPDWVDGYFKELRYSYIEVVSGTATDCEAARNKAAQMIIQRRNMAAGQQVNVSVSNGNVMISGSDGLIVKAHVLDEYVQYLGPGQWNVHLLVQTCRNPSYDYEAVTVTDRYGLSPLAFIPGMAQFRKEQTVKGTAFVAFEALMVGGIVAFEGLRQSNSNKAKGTHQAKQKTQYIDNANTCSDLRNGCIAGAAIVYAWSLIDAVTAKGPRHVLLGNAEVLVMPYANLAATGLALNINF